MPHWDEKAWSKVLDSEDTEPEKPATADQIAAFEKKHGFQFPEAHREFLLRSNGGVFGIARVFGVERRGALDLAKHLRDMKKELEETAPGPVFPFANDWGGSYFCYDLRKPPTARGYPVLFWNHEYSEEPDDREMLWEKFARDFVSFLKDATAD